MAKQGYALLCVVEPNESSLGDNSYQRHQPLLVCQQENLHHALERKAFQRYVARIDVMKDGLEAVHPSFVYPQIVDSLPQRGAVVEHLLEQGAVAGQDFLVCVYLLATY